MSERYYDLGELVEGSFVKRLNRFAALVELEGEIIEAHVANTGRMGELLYSGVPIWLKKAANPNRKLAYDLLLSEYEGRKICLNAQLANDFFAHWLSCGYLDKLKNYPNYRREYRFHESRFDFLLENAQGQKLLLEVKSVNYLIGKAAVFPDAPTERGRRHLEKLVKWQNEGLGQSAVCFVVMGHEAEYLRMNIETDPLFAASLNKALDNGVQVLVYKSRIEDNKVYFDAEINYQR